MIQRIQSVWLLLAAIAAALTFKYSFYSGIMEGRDGTTYFVASSNFLLLILTLLLACGCLVLIFLYKDRKKQLRFTILATVVSILNIVIYFTQIKKFTSGAFSLTAILAFGVPIFLFLAIRGIWKDEKLIKSLDRLR